MAGSARGLKIVPVLSSTLRYPDARFYFSILADSVSVGPAAHRGLGIDPYTLQAAERAL